MGSFSLAALLWIMHVIYLLTSGHPLFWRLTLPIYHADGTINSSQSASHALLASGAAAWEAGFDLLTTFIDGIDFHFAASVVYVCKPSRRFTGIWIIKIFSIIMLPLFCKSSNNIWGVWVPNWWNNSFSSLKCLCRSDGTLLLDFVENVSRIAEIYLHVIVLLKDGTLLLDYVENVSRIAEIYLHVIVLLKCQLLCWASGGGATNSPSHVPHIGVSYCCLVCSQHVKLHPISQSTR